MNHPSHSATTASSASGQASYKRIISPFLSTIRKTLTLGTREKNISINGCRHEFFPGHPVIVGYVLLLGGEKSQTRFWVTGDTDDKYVVTLTIQSKERDGSAIQIDKKSLSEAMEKAQGMTQKDIFKNLQVGDYSWMKTIDPKKSELTRLQEWAHKNRLRVHDDSSATHFMMTVRKHIVSTIATARRLELERFLVAAIMQEHDSGRLAEVYNDCGWTYLAERKDLAELNPEKLAREYEDKLPMEVFEVPYYSGL